MKLRKVIFREHIVGLGSSLNESSAALHFDDERRILRVTLHDRPDLYCVVPVESVAVMYQAKDDATAMPHADPNARVGTVVAEAKPEAVVVVPARKHAKK